MSASPFMQLYVADYLGDTRHLTTEQHGAYLLILMAMWRQAGSLPNDPAKLARIAGVSPRRWHLLAEDVMAFFEIEDGKITQKRLVEEYQKSVSISEKRSVNGKRGGEAKSLKNSDSCMANAKQMPQHSQIPYREEEKREDKSSPKKPPSRRTSIPPDWRPSQANLDFARTKNLSEMEISNAASQFADYHRAKGTVFADWDAGWRTWVGNHRRFSGGGMAGTAHTGAGQRVVSLASIAARNRDQGFG